jgi:hypothetical protein
VTAVVRESLERAEAWVERLRAVGLQRGADGGAALMEMGPPPPLSVRTAELERAPQEADMAVDA